MRFKLHSVRVPLTATVLALVFAAGCEVSSTPVVTLDQARAEFGKFLDESPAVRSSLCQVATTDQMNTPTFEASMDRSYQEVVNTARQEGYAVGFNSDEYIEMSRQLISEKCSLS